MWGISYPGFYTAAGMIDAHPALKAASPQAPVTDWFVGDDFHHNGAFFLPHAFNFMASFGQPAARADQEVRPRRSTTARPTATSSSSSLGPLANADAQYFKGDVAFWNEVMQHGNYDDFWKARNLRPHLKNIKPAVMTVGGWFDAENLFGALEDLQARSRRTAPAPTTSWSWARGSTAAGARGDGDIARATSASTPRRPSSTASRSSCRSSSTTSRARATPTLPEALGLRDRHEPLAAATTPGRRRTAEPQSLYFHAGGKLAFEPPADSRRATAFDEYVSDPAKPVPSSTRSAIGMTPRVHDRRPALRRAPARRARLPDRRRWTRT